MTVATTASPRSSLRSCRSMAVIARISSPSTRTPRSSTAITRSASPSNARPASARATSTASCRSPGWVDPQPALMFTPSGEAWITSTVAPSAARRGRGAERGAVAAVDHHVQTAELAALQGVDERGDVLVERGAVLARHPDAHTLGPGFRLGDRERAELLLHLQLKRLGDLAPAGHEQLHAVVPVRVVARRDDRRRGAASRAT